MPRLQDKLPRLQQQSKGLRASTTGSAHVHCCRRRRRATALQQPWRPPRAIACGWLSALHSTVTYSCGRPVPPCINRLNRHVLPVAVGPNPGPHPPLLPVPRLSRHAQAHPQPARRYLKVLRPVPQSHASREPSKGPAAAGHRSMQLAGHHAPGAGMLQYMVCERCRATCTPSLTSLALSMSTDHEQGVHACMRQAEGASQLASAEFVGGAASLAGAS